MKLVLIACLLLVGTFALPKTSDVIPEIDDAIADAKTLEVPESEPEELTEADSAKGNVYKIQTITFAGGQRGRDFKKYLYKNICPRAAANMKTCIRCKGPGGVCVEFMKFSSHAQFAKYGQYKWVPRRHMAAFMTSGTKTSGMSDVPRSSFTAALKDKNCEVVRPFGSKRRSSKRKSRGGGYYVTTTITFGKPSFKQYMYKNICPLAAAEMVDCFRCAKNGKCVEFQKFKSKADFVKYKKLKWLPMKHLRAWGASGSSTNGYHPISAAQYHRKMRALGNCERVRSN